MDSRLKSVALSLGLLTFSHGEPIFAPGDPIIGGARVGDNFEVGFAGTAAGINNWPGAEPPSDIINGVIGGGGEKYLNFAELNTGFIITPASGASIVTSMELWTANDAVDRDPASFEIYGTNEAIGAGPYAFADFTLISEGDLDLPDDRDLTLDDIGFSQVVQIGDGNAYTSYMVIFPTVKNEIGANSMQLSEIQFDDTVAPGSGVVEISSILYSPDSDEVTVSWNSRPGASYTVQSSEDLVDWGNNVTTGLPADGGEVTTFTFNLAENNLTDLSKLFFRVEVE